MKLWKLQELTLDEVTKQKYEVAILPIGSTEAHGPHVPYGSDAFHSTAIAERVCQRAWARKSRPILLPTIPYGVQGNTMGFPLAMNVSQHLLDSIVIDITASLEHYRILKLVLINGHGGNDFKPLLRSLYGRTKVFVSLVDWWKVGQDKVKEIFENSGEHADELETSVGLALFGDLIHLERTKDGATRKSRFEAINRGWVSITRPWHLVTKDSTYGDPRKASKEKGEAYLRIVVDRISDYLVELAKSRMDARFPY
ncbi:MAG: creatininase family protein [Ignavibacteriales bacterium]|nr:creatininase family protein [Ignavibacteriales bacterium]